MNPILLDLPLPILTPRLMLRPAQAGDGLAVHEAKRESWAELSLWGIWTWKPFQEMTVEDDELFCRRSYVQFILREKIRLLAFDRIDGTFIGSGSLNDCDWDLRIFSLGYWVRTGRTGQGYATEIAAALVAYAFDTLDATKLKSMHGKGNTGSQHVLEKTGFEREGILRGQYRLYDGSLTDEYVYGMFRDRKASE